MEVKLNLMEGLGEILKDEELEGREVQMQRSPRKAWIREALGFTYTLRFTIEFKVKFISTSWCDCSLGSPNKYFLLGMEA